MSLLSTGTWKIPRDDTVDNVDLAFEVGFDHIDTAQIYGRVGERSAYIIAWSVRDRLY